MTVQLSAEIDAYIRCTYATASSVAGISQELAHRFGFRITPKALTARARKLGVKRREAYSRRPWSPEHLALLKVWAEEGLPTTEQFCRLEALAPGHYNWQTLHRQRRNLGLQRPQPWRGKPQEILERMYGTWSPRAIANAIERETGWRPSRNNIVLKAFSLGLSVATAQGHRTLSDAARELSLDTTTLKHAIKALGIRKRGRGQVRYLDERSLATLRAVFPKLDEPVVTTKEAAHILGMDAARVSALCREGILDGRRYGLGIAWRIPLRELSRYKARPGWFRCDGRELPPHYLLDTYVVATQALYAVSRRDGTTLAPSPNSKRMHFRKGVTVGSIKGRRAGLLLIETSFGLVHCAAELLQPEVYAPPPQIIWWRQSLSTEAA